VSKKEEAGFMSTTSYDYKIKILKQIRKIVLTIIPLIICYSLAENNESGLNLRNTDFGISSSGATNLYWGFTLFFVALSVFGIFNMAKALIAPEKQIILGETGISAPKSLYSNKIVDIPYSEVTDMIDKTINSPIKIFTTVTFAIHGNNSKITIDQNGLASEEKFLEMRNNLIERVEQKE
jgi:hypothetical protein